MISAFSVWLRHLVVLILLAVLLDALLPRSAIQRYARTVIGLVVVLALLNPLRSLATAGLNVGRFEQLLSGPMLNQSTVSGVSGAAFRVDLESALRAGVQATLGVTLADVQVTIVAKADGTPVVTSVQADASGGPTGVATATEAAAVRVEIADQLGLSPERVSVAYPGGSSVRP